MPTFKETLIRNNMVAAPIISLLIGVLVLYASLYIYSLLIYLVPVETFFVFHYLKQYRLLKRVLGGAIVFIVFGIIASASFANIIYSATPTYTLETSTGLDISASVTPYSISSPGTVFHYSLFVHPANSSVITPEYNTSELIIKGSGSFIYTITRPDLNVVTYSNGSALVTANVSTLRSGIYSYNYSVVQNGNRSYSSQIGGPIYTTELSLFGALIPSYTPYYAVLFEIIFVVGVLIGRSIGNSMRYSQQRKQQ
ncbi:MAG TPA: hypothetical protein VKU79_07045 [Thermoplasmataceae archaeon]|nr:hypothetical protein [Thermoplasmatales archaeon AK]HLH86601.1 hypothetical protein [Thermoplasmataceae archaeon]